MTEDQKRRLAELSHKLAEVYLNDADPDNWNGDGEAQVDMSKEIRGARNWDMKNANLAGALLVRSMDIAERLAGGRGPVPDADPEGDMRRFEGAAAKMLERVSRR